MSAQLELILKARDESRSAFQSMRGGLKSVSDGVRDLNGAAKEERQSLRALRFLQGEAELYLKGMQLVASGLGAVFASVNGTMEQAAQGQRAFFDAVKEVPIIGGMLSAAGEKLSGFLAHHVFGTQSTADMEADLAKRKTIVGNYKAAIAAIAEKRAAAHNEAALIGLAPDDAEIEKAKQQYKKAIDELKPLKQALFAAAGAAQSGDERQWEIIQAGHLLNSASEADKEAGRKKLEEMGIMNLEEVQRQAKLLGDAEADLQKVRDAAISAPNAKRVRDEQNYQRRLLAVERAGVEALAQLQEDVQQKQLESDNRGYEARLAALARAGERQVAEIREEEDRKLAELEKQREELLAREQAGDKDAAAKRQQLFGEQARVHANSETQQQAARQGTALSAALERQNQLRASGAAILQRQADAGDEAARIELDRLNHARELEASQKALAAVGRDQAATAEQKTEAARQLVELGKAEQAVLAHAVQQEQLSILERQGQLGDEAARLKAEQLKLTIEQTAEEARLNAILKDQAATAEQKKAAQQSLNDLKNMDAQRSGNALRDAGMFLLQKEADLGNRIAETDLRKLQIAAEYNAERAKLNAILAGNASAVDKEAAKGLTALGASEKRALQGLNRPGQPQSATFSESFYETGVAASYAQEKAPFQPVVDAMGPITDICKTMRDLLDKIAGKAGPAMRPIPRAT